MHFEKMSDRQVILFVLSYLNYVFNPILDGHFRGCSRMGGGEGAGQKDPLSLKSITHILE